MGSSDDSESKDSINDSCKDRDCLISRTRGRYRKKMRREFDESLYHQRNKTETIFSVIKRMFGENVTSRKISTQNRELMYRVITYNAYRITRDNLLIWYDF